MIDVELDVASAGRVDTLSPTVRRILAPNPSLMTGRGTNTYLVGADDGDFAVIDPGPDDATHLDAIAKAGNGRIRWIVVTHTHPDHSPGVPGLVARTGARVLAYEARDGLEIDERLADGDTVPATDAPLTVLHTPGHASNHLCLLLDDPASGKRILFTGDHVMHGSTVVIFPPDGDVRAYLQQLERVRALAPTQLAPAHGQLFEDPASAIAEIIEHRLAREAKIAEALAAAGRPVTVDELLGAVYDDIEPRRLPIARGSLWAHLRKLVNDGRATTDGYDDLEGGRWEFTPL
ncbi:MAG: MBL fold metallo-hydrolase [Solirubrobacteraceae bacterium]|nr:MBL fold metallo-hydrolase [Solirubrobacteraceae bacterium]